MTYDTTYDRNLYSNLEINLEINLDTNFAGSSSRSQRSNAMYTMQEALAREHLRDLQRSAHRNALSRELASASRWHRLERRSRAASQRHAQRAHRVAQVSAVAD